jgi:dihydrolipoamide dehydrogenase
MSNQTEVRVPNIGEFKDVDVIEVLVRPGDRVEAEASLITLESDKATLEIPSPLAGTVLEVRVRVGDKVSEGTPILTVEALEEARAVPAPPPSSPASAAAPAQPGAGTTPAGARAPAASAGEDAYFEVVVLGGGPGGYTAAFRAADLGKRVAIVDRGPTLGGVCLNVGCIPSKALLHAAEVVTAAREMAAHGVRFGAPEIDLPALRSWKDAVVARLTGGLAQLARQRKVDVIRGEGRFYSANRLLVETGQGRRMIGFDHAVIAVGSEPVRLPGVPHEDPRVIDSTGALALADVPGRLLVIGGGIIGLEMATVYDALGSRVTVVELTEGLLPGCDPDLVRPLQRRLAKRLEGIHLGTRVARVEAEAAGLRVHFEGAKAPAAGLFDRVLVAVGRRPNGALVGAENAGVFVDPRGFIPVDRQLRTGVANIFAIGDVVGQPMLAHKATHEGKVAAEVIAGKRASFDARAIPSVAYTDPEVAWMGVSEAAARQQGLEVDKATFPWAASGRGLGMGRDEGLTKLLFDHKTGRLVGAGIVGPRAGDLIAETVLALEMGADAADIGLTIHPHPTLSETVAFAAEMAEGTITDLLAPRKR